MHYITREEATTYLQSSCGSLEKISSRSDILCVPNLLSFHVLKGLIGKQKNLY